MNKPMFYQANRKEPPDILASGKYKGFDYYILDLGTHPCAYIDVSHTKLNGVDYDDIDLQCHCGLTYSNARLKGVDKVGWYIGWDYAHYCDFVGYTLMYPTWQSNGKMWTTEEIVAECQQVITRLKNMLYKTEENVNDR